MLSVSWVERKKNKCVWDHIGFVLMLRNSMAERKMRFFGHSVRKDSKEKIQIQGKVESRRRRGKPAKSWFQDGKDWTKLDMADASQLATGRERYNSVKSPESQPRR